MVWRAFKVHLQIRVKIKWMLYWIILNQVQSIQITDGLTDTNKVLGVLNTIASASKRFLLKIELFYIVWRTAHGLHNSSQWSSLVGLETVHPHWVTCSSAVVRTYCIDLCLFKLFNSATLCYCYILMHFEPDGYVLVSCESKLML